MATADAAAAIQYAQCQQKHRSVVSAYDQVKALIQGFIDSLQEKDDGKAAVPGSRR